MTRRIFIWVAHPKADTLSSALADAYETGARARGAEIRRMDLSAMTFDMEKPGYGRRGDTLEPDLARWQENVAWADHLFIVHPYWWGAMPTKAKAVLDRALTPGFGYKYHKRGMGWDKLLAGRTADAIITSDTPPRIDTLVYWRPGRRVLRNQVLKFCGIKPKTILQFGSVKMAGAAKIAGWIGRAERLGGAAAA